MSSPASADPAAPGSAVERHPGRPPVPEFRTLLGVSLTCLGGLLALVALGQLSGQLLLIPAMAGTMALVGAAPSFALAQPRNVILGQATSAAIGLGVGVVSHSLWAAAVGATAAVTVMLLWRCAHAPAAATAVIGVTTLEGHLAFFLCTVAAAVVITLSAVVAARWTGSGYPLRRW